MSYNISAKLRSGTEMKKAIIAAALAAILTLVHCGNVYAGIRYTYGVHAL